MVLQTCSGGGIFVRGKSVVTTNRTTLRRNKATRKISKWLGVYCGVRRPASAPFDLLLLLWSAACGKAMVGRE